MPSILIHKTETPAILDIVKRIADQHRTELGFHTKQSFLDSILRKELLIAEIDDCVVGFTRFHHRKDKRTTLYEIVTIPEARGLGVGRYLMNALIDDCRLVGSRELRLSCPADLPANKFYASLGFIRHGAKSKSERKRPLNEWHKLILPRRTIKFVASWTDSGFNLKRLISMWEKEGPNTKPFDMCIITPLFTEPSALDCVRYVHDQWGVDVIFDSGGFFVQQEKIQYEELFVRLLEFYIRHQWAEVYVLPDFVPTSRNSPKAVAERVYVTASEGVKLLNRLPVELRHRALGVLQGHTSEQLKHCLEVYLGSGLKRIGFGSFDTAGANEEINLLTHAATNRLSFVRDYLQNAFLSGLIESLPDLHLFGISSPSVIHRFPGFLANSFDSSAWQRTAGFGNIYLPYESRRNITHGSSAISNGEGFNAAQYYANCERTGHSCPFCQDFSRLQKDRFARMWHNAIVFDDMTKAINQTN